MSTAEEKKQIVEFFLKQKLLTSPDLLGDVQNLASLNFEVRDGPVTVNSDVISLLDTKIENVNWSELEKLRVNYEKHKGCIYQNFLGALKAPLTKAVQERGVKVLFSFDEEPKKREVRDFISYFNARYSALRKILQNRPELTSLVSINKIFGKKEKESVSIIGMVVEKRVTKNGNIILAVEDPTGEINVVVNKNKQDIFETAKESALDEVIGICGVADKTIVFANSVILPDVPATKELKKSPDEVYAVFIGDMHFGHKLFMKKEFEKFISWIRGEVGSDKQKEVAQKVKYVFILGDLVEGVGIHPSQFKDLEIADIYKQYELFTEYIKQIPPAISLIIIPGNHDAMRIAEPQPPLYEDFAKPLYCLPNTYMLSNPAIVNIHSSPGFPGFDVLLYHGFSFPYYADTVESIRLAGGLKCPDVLMKYLLRRRHLAPAHTSSLYLPIADKDPLVITTVPDLFATGHIHRVSVSSYRNVTLMNCSSWVESTEYQEKTGLTPQPGRCLIANLQTREVSMLKF